MWNLAAAESPSKGLRSDTKAPQIFKYARSPDYLTLTSSLEGNKIVAVDTNVLSSPIVALKLLNRGPNSSHSFQFCVLDARGNVGMWIAMRIACTRGPDLTGIDGHIRLIQLTRLNSEVRTYPKVNL